uniref:regulator of microtubule dynamics protein 2-like isoform X2 n=1 Tax=Myxine glutinosa TaxID=7769 RepID=UPI0035901748
MVSRRTELQLITAGCLTAGLLGFGLAWLFSKRDRRGNKTGYRGVAAWEAVAARERTDILNKLAGLLSSVAEVRREVQELKAALPRAVDQAIRARRRRTLSNTSSSVYFTVSNDEVDDTTGVVDIDDAVEKEDDTRATPPEETADAAVSKECCENTALELDELLAKADALHAGKARDKEQAFELLHSRKEEFAEDSEFCWRMARACGDMCDIAQGDGERIKKYASLGKAILSCWLDHDTDVKHHQWFAILCSLLAEYEPLPDKMKNVFHCKEHLDKACEMDGQDPLTHHLLGCWAYSASKMMWIEHEVGRDLFKDFPSASIQDALDSFLKTEQIQPEFSITNQVYLAKCCMELNRRMEALKWLESAVKLPVVTSKVEGFIKVYAVPQMDARLGILAPSMGWCTLKSPWCPSQTDELSLVP